MLADLESLERRTTALEKKAKGGDKEAAQTLALVKLALEQLNAGKPARKAKVDPDDEKAWQMLQLLTSKPALYVCNVEEGAADKGNALSDAVPPAPPRTTPNRWSSPPRSRPRGRGAGRPPSAPSSWRRWDWRSRG